MSATPGRRHQSLSQSHPRSQSRRQSTTHSAGPELVTLPTYETPEAPLTVEGQRQIAALLSSQHLRALRTHLQHAAEKLTHSGGEVNERLCDARTRYERSKEFRRRRGDETVGDAERDEEYQKLAVAEARVDAITARMEEKTRLIVDSEVKLQALTDTMTQIEREEGEAVSAALGARQTRQQRSRLRAEAGEGSEGEDPDDADYEDPAEREARERNAQNPPSRKLDDRLTEGVQKWDELSLTEKYASNNSYIGFYRMVHDSKFPGDDVPPLPHSSTWFNHMEDTNVRSGTSARTRNQNRGPSPADSDDIAIERERVSLKCPLTLTPYVDPVTSTKCPHSFEREAIMDMIKRSRTTIAPPASRQGQRRIHMVKCPVCSTPLTADDLRPDPVLLRRVRRAQELQEREEEDDHLEGDGRKQKDRSTNITLASDGESDDDAMDIDAPPTQRIKPEPLSQSAAAQADGSDEGAESEDAEDAEDDGEYQEEVNQEEANREEEENDTTQNTEKGDESDINEGQADEGQDEDTRNGTDGAENEEEQDDDVENGDVQDTQADADTQSDEGQNDAASEDAQEDVPDSKGRNDADDVPVQREEGESNATAGKESSDNISDSDISSDRDIPPVESESEDDGQEALDGEDPERAGESD